MFSYLLPYPIIAEKSTIDLFDLFNLGGKIAKSTSINQMNHHSFSEIFRKKTWLFFEFPV